MDSRLRGLAEQLDAGLIARRAFLQSMASAQPRTKLRVWLFKSYVTAGNDIEELDQDLRDWGFAVAPRRHG